jgi:hypothetical protein
MSGRGKERPIAHKVISGVVSGLVVLAVGTGFAYYVGWTKFGGWVPAGWAGLCSTVAWVWRAVLAVLNFGVPVWLLLALGAAGFLFRTWQRGRPKAQPTPGEPPILFHELHWRRTPVGWLPFCPTCDLQVHPTALGPGSMFRHGPIFFRCDHCQRDLTSYKGPYEDLVDLLEREAQREDRAEKGVNDNVIFATGRKAARCSPQFKHRGL